MMEIFHTVIDKFFGMIKGDLGVAGAISLCALLYFLIYMPSMKFFRKELKKREMIVSKIKNYKEGFILQKEEQAENVDMKMNNLLNFKHQNLPERYFKELTDIVRGHRPKPLWALGFLSFQLAVLLIFLSYFLTLNLLEENIYIILLPLLLMGIMFRSKEYRILKVLFISMLMIVYLNFNAEALLFISSVLLFRLAHQFITQFKKEH